LASEIRTAQANVSEAEIAYFDFGFGYRHEKGGRTWIRGFQTPNFAYTNPTAETVAVAR